jgi:hypothetical protein
MLSHSPSIVTDGLVLCLDAANPRSYGGSGTTWSDLSGNGNNGTLVNGPTFNTGSLGSIQFDGVNDFIVTTRVPYTGTSTSSITWGLWVYPTSTAGNIMSMSNISPQGIWNMPPIAASGQKFRGKIWSNSYLYSDTFSLNTWYYVVLVWRYSTNSSERGQFLYINGELVASQTNINYSASGADNYMFLGQANPGADNTGNFAGRYALFHIYGNKYLTPQEIEQNFKATRGRFGI